MTTPIIRRVKPVRTKRNYSSFTLQEAMLLIPAERFTPWRMTTLPKEPSDLLTGIQKRLSAFNLHSSEQAKILLMDTVFLEVVPDYPNLMVWKAAPLETDTLTGVADYVIAPNRAYFANPLLCVVEAKKDDFEQGRTQCVIEMIACKDSNQKHGASNTVYGIVSNGQVWQFYKLTPDNAVHQSGLFTMDGLPELLGAVDYVCGECAKNVPQS